MTNPRPVRLAATGVLVTLGATGVTMLALFGTEVVAFVEWVQGAGVIGVAVYGVVLFVAATFMVPASIPEMVAGFLWGPLLGFVVVYALTLCASVLCLVLGRTLLRGFVERRISRYPRFKRLDYAIGTGGWYLVLLLRLSPIAPFNIVTYALALTRVSVRDFVIGTAVGAIAPVFLYTYIGSTVTSAAQVTAQPTAGWLYWTGLIVTIAVTIPITRFAAQAVRTALRPPSEEPVSRVGAVPPGEAG